MEDTMVIEGITDVQRMWTLGERVLLSTSSSTAMVTLEPAEVELCAELASTPTIAAGMIRDKLVTVKEAGVDVWSDIASGSQASWPASGVVTAAFGGGHVAVAVASQVAVLSDGIKELG
jgi:DNA damage-binding protein 1